MRIPNTYKGNERIQQIRVQFQPPRISRFHVRREKTIFVSGSFPLSFPFVSHFHAIGRKQETKRFKDPQEAGPHRCTCLIVSLQNQPNRTTRARVETETIAEQHDGSPSAFQSRSIALYRLERPSAPIGF